MAVFPKLSLAVTVAENALPAVAFASAVVVSAEAAPGVALAVKVRGLPVRPALVAVRVLLLVPAVVPSFQEPTVAMPEALVVWEPPVTEPPPVAAAKVTEAPETGLPN